MGRLHFKNQKNSKALRVDDHVLEKIGNLHEAEPCLHQALEIRHRLLPKGNQLIWQGRRNLGECLTF